MEKLLELIREAMLARAGVADVESALPEILAALPDPAMDFDTRAELLMVVDRLMREHVIPERLPLRMATLARIAWRTQRVVGLEQSIRVGLIGAYFLRQRDADQEALELIEAIEVDARSEGGELKRATTAMRARCLVELQRYLDAHNVVLEYESGVPPEVADSIELQILLAGATAATNAGHAEIAVKRARRVVDLLDSTAADTESDSFANAIFSAPTPAAVYLVYGDVLRAARLQLDAINAFQTGRARALQAQDRLGAAWCLSEVGITWQHLSEFERGQQLLEQAAWEAEQAGDLKAAARWRGQRVQDADGVRDMNGVNGLATIYRTLQESGPSAELERLTKIIIKANRGTGNGIEPMARNLLAGIYAAGKQFELALAAVGAAIATVEKREDKWLTLAFRSHQAQILFRQGFWASANEVCDRIFAEVDRLLEETHISEIRQTALAAISVATEVALITASTDGEHESGKILPRDPQRVYSVTDRTRARTFNYWLSLLDWSRRSNASNLAAAARDLVSADLVIEWTVNAGRPVSNVLESRSRAAENLARAASSAGVTLPLLSVDGFADVMANLPPRTKVLDLNAVEHGVVCLCYEFAGPPRVEQLRWERPRRTAWVARFRAVQTEMTHRHPSDASDVMVGAFKELYDELASELSGPLVSWLGADVDHLIVSMHAELASIPLWGLVRGLPGVAVSVVPALRSVALLKLREAAVGGTRIAIGDATGSLRMAPRECELLQHFQPVAVTVDEIRGAAITARRIHFAGHGEFDAENPYSSGLILQGVPQPPYAVPSTYPGCVRLTIPGVLQWLDVTGCELVTISACSVGTPRSHAASEFTSVPIAFLLAGARNVLAAGWAVNDAAATVLMNYFYQQLESGVGPAAALAAARRMLAGTGHEEASLILGSDDVIPPGDKPFDSPMYTDAFMHYGLG